MIAQGRLEYRTDVRKLPSMSRQEAARFELKTSLVVVCISTTKTMSLLVNGNVPSVSRRWLS